MFALVTNMCYMFFEHFNCAFPDNKLKGANHFKAKYFGITCLEYSVKSMSELEECGSEGVNISTR
jgi:hypothetical protein